MSSDVPSSVSSGDASSPTVVHPLIFFISPSARDKVETCSQILVTWELNNSGNILFRMDVYMIENNVNNPATKEFVVQKDIPARQLSLLWKVNIPPGPYYVVANTSDTQVAFGERPSLNFVVTDGGDTSCLTTRPGISQTQTQTTQSSSSTVPTSTNPTESSAVQTHKKGPPPAGLVAGAIIGSLAAVPAIIIAIIILVRRNKYQQRLVPPTASEITPYPSEATVAEKVSRKWTRNLRNHEETTGIGETQNDMVIGEVNGEGGDGGIDRVDQLWEQMQLINQRVAHIEVEQGPPEYMSQANVERSDTP